MMLFPPSFSWTKLCIIIDTAALAIASSKKLFWEQQDANARDGSSCRPLKRNAV